MMKKNRKTNFFLFLYTSFLVLLTININPSYAWNTQLGFWNLDCEYQKFPSPHIANKHGRGKRYNIQVCTATQSIRETVENEPLEFTITLTPFDMAIIARNINPKKRSAKLIVGPYHYALFPNCRIKDGEPACIFFLSGTAQIQSALSKMKQQPSCIIQLIDKEEEEALDITFSLDQFRKVQNIMQNSQQKIKNVFDRLSMAVPFKYWGTRNRIMWG